MKSEVFNEDCKIGMSRFPDGYWDLAIVDPPYFSGPEKRRYYGSEKSAMKIKRVDYGTMDTWVVPGNEYFKELFRVSKRQIVWGCNYYKYQFGPGRIVWDKCNQGTSFSDCELAYCSMHDSVRLFRYMWNGMMQGKSLTEGHIQRGNKRLNQKRIHTTEKPIELYQWCLKKYAHPGMKILDTHLGSGSHRIAAWDMGLDFYGWEIDPVCFEEMDKRFWLHVQSNQNSKLFDPRPFSFQTSINYQP